MAEDLLEQLRWRCIGPFRGGRVVAVAGHPTDKATFYFGSTGGGLWKTTDAGLYWENISDGFFQRASVGALCVAPSDPNVIYAGMGETTIRGNVSHGDGVYKSTDGGRSWRHLGLAATRSIAAIRTHPTDPELVYVAAFGHAHGPNPERGLYRSRNGGRAWELALFRSGDTGAIDLALDSHNPRRLYVAFWEGRRGPHYMRSGGPGSGLFRSDDGGLTFTELTERPGLPRGLLGKIGLAASPAREGQLWAIVEHEQGGVFRSDDAGETWVKLNADGELRQRAWYYSHIIADPGDADSVWVLNLDAWRSIDGGRTFTAISTPHSDHHALWIDPADARRMIMGHDGGASVSLNGGRSWSPVHNQPTAELYHVALDNRDPYWAYAGQQDNTSIATPSWSANGFIPYAASHPVGGGESAHVAIRADNPDIVFAGDQQGRMTRYNQRTGELRDVSVWPEHVWGTDGKDRPYRFNWTFPIYLSPHDPNLLYCAANVVFRSADEGLTWERISGDLTRNDPGHMQPSGPVGENANGEQYGTLYTIAESRLVQGLFWVGSDDGRVHLARDGGAEWRDVTPAELPEWSHVSCIAPGEHAAGTAFLAADRHKLDDVQPLLFRTTDFGESWTRIIEGIPADDFMRVIREDPQQPGLLYAGSETGLYVSYDAGGNWSRGAGSLPVVPVHDLAVRGHDLVAATHGRSFWVTSDLDLLRVAAVEQPGDEPWLYVPPVVVRRVGQALLLKDGYASGGGRGTLVRNGVPLDSGENPVAGAAIRYVLPTALVSGLRLSIHHADGREVRAYKGAPDGAPQPGQPSAQAGLNRFVWDLRCPAPEPVSTSGGDRMNAAGARVPPGDYEVRLSLNGQTLTAPLHVEQDPASSAGQADLEAQFELHQHINAAIGEVNAAINRIRALRGQLDPWLVRLHGRDDLTQLREAGAALLARLSDVEAELIQVDANNMEDTLRLPAKLNAKLVWLTWTISTGDAAPTAASLALFAELRERVDEQLDRLRMLLETELAAVNAGLRDAGLTRITA